MPLLTAADLRRLAPLTAACLTALLGVAALLALDGRRDEALATVAAFAGCLALVLPPRERMPVLPWRLRALPRGCDAAPVLATLLSVPGYALGWFYGDNLYDETVHALNGVLAGAVFLHAWRLDGRARTPRQMAVGALVAGTALAVGWELFEGATGLIGDAVDTVSDVLLTVAGVVAGALAAARHRPGPVALASNTPMSVRGRGSRG